MVDSPDVDAQATPGAIPGEGATPSGQTEQAPAAGAIPPAGEDESKRLSAALKAERDARKAAEKALKDAQAAQTEGLTESERLTQRVAELEQAKLNAERDAMIIRIANETGLPILLASRLQGSDENSLRDDALALKAALPAQPPAAVNHTSVAGPQGPPAAKRSPEEWAAWLHRK